MPVAILAVSACAVSVPVVALPAPVSDVGFSVKSQEVAPVPTDWWTSFGDDRLTELVIHSLKRNGELRATDAATRALEGVVRQTELARSSSTFTSASADIGRPPGDGRDIQETLSGGLSANWEFDAFGRLRALQESAQLDLETQRQVRRDLAVTIASETALAYIDLRGARVRLDVAQRNAEAQKEGLDLIATLFDNGRATQLDFERADAQFRTTLASIPVFEAAIAEARNRLAALTGAAATDPGQLIADLASETSDIPELRGAIASGDPASLLRRRPDIRAAEAQVGSRLALSEAARADLFPRISLSAGGSALFGDVSDFGRTTSLGFGVGPMLSWAGPDLRRVRANILVADARIDQALAVYEQTVLDALRDAETALTNYSRELERRADLVAAVGAAGRALDIATLRFQEGLDDYLDVLDAQRTLLDTEDRLALSQAETARRAVRAYRSLGGVWDDAVLMDFRNSDTDGQDT